MGAKTKAPFKWSILGWCRPKDDQHLDLAVKRSTHVEARNPSRLIEYQGLTDRKYTEVKDAYES